MRFRSAAEAREMRARFELQVYLAGLLIAGFVAIPLLNLLTPLFATTLMARLHKRLVQAGLIAGTAPVRTVRTVGPVRQGYDLIGKTRQVET
jgi:CysZ protein